MTNGNLTQARINSWVIAMISGFGWEVDRQAKKLNDELDLEITNDNHPTAMNSVWRCGSGQGIYFLRHDGTVELKACPEAKDFDDVDGEIFFAEVRIRNDRGAEVLFIDQNDPNRVLTSAELASYFVDRVRDNDQG